MALSPGRLMLPTRPSLTGSAAAWKTIGIASVAALAASAGPSIKLILRPTIVDHDVPAINETDFAQPLTKRRQKIGARLRPTIMEKPDHRHRRLLRARRERPRSCRATEQRDERAAPHSRTSLARATNTSDKETPSDAAVLRLTAM